MPTLLEVERAVYRSVVGRDDATAIQYVLADDLAPGVRLNVYRNNFVSALTSALRLSFPAIYRLVGAGFFESAARIFIEQTPPPSAYLNDYGADFPAFLEDFPPAAALAYLSGVARLEWAVNCALHAADAEALDVGRLAAIDSSDHGRICFVPHPSIGLVRADYPVDVIWRAVLSHDDSALSGIDLGAGAVWLLVQRRTAGVDVSRVSEPAWRFAAELCASRPLQAAIDAAPGADVMVALAEHLAAGRFIGFELIGNDDAAYQDEVSV
jgi:hypothetical protein